MAGLGRLVQDVLSRCRSYAYAIGYADAGGRLALVDDSVAVGSSPGGWHRREISRVRHAEAGSRSIVATTPVHHAFLPLQA